MRPRLGQLHPSGATNGQVPVYNTSTGLWEPGAPAAGYTDEQARDAVGAALVAGSGISVVVDDGADTITISRDAATVTSVYMPLTTVVGGVPELVWDADDSLIPTEVPL